jgi:hypothetical protein
MSKINLKILTRGHGNRPSMAKPQNNRAPSAVCVDANREIGLARPPTSTAPFLLPGGPGLDPPVNAHHEKFHFHPAWRPVLGLAICVKTPLWSRLRRAGLDYRSIARGTVQGWRQHGVCACGRREDQGCARSGRWRGRRRRWAGSRRGRTPGFRRLRRERRFGGKGRLAPGGLRRRRGSGPVFGRRGTRFFILR